MRTGAAAAALCVALLGSARAQNLQQEKTSVSATSIAGTNWTTPTNIQTDDNQYASYANTLQNWLVVKTFGFSIPAASVIDGIIVVAQGNGAGNTAAKRKFEAAMTKDGATAAGTSVGLSFAGSTDADVAVSTPGASWNTTWAAADINSANFGVMFRDFDTTNNQLNFDTMTVTVQYRTVDTITVTPTALAPANIQQGSDYAVEKLSLATNANTATWTAITVAKTGTLADAGVTAVKIYLDANGNGTYEAGSDTLITSGANAFTAGSAAITLTASQTITTTAKVYFVVYVLSAASTIGNTIGANIASNASLTVTSPDAVAATNLPAASGTSTVTDGPDTVTVTPTNQAGASVNQGADYSVEKLSLATNQETATWTAVTVAKTGTLADAKVTTVKIYLDANANGTYESGTDTLISPAVTIFSGGSAAITLSAAQTITTTPKVYFVVYALDATATPGATIGASIGTTALTLTAPDLLAATNLPANSTNSSVTDVADTATFAGTDAAPATVIQGGDFAVEKLSVATGGDQATWTAITVKRTGTLPDAKVTTVKIYLDDGSGVYDGGDTLISPAATTFSAGTAAITLSAAQTITTTPKVYFVVYTLDVTATVSNTIGAEVTAGTSLALTAPDLVSGAFPINSSNAAVVAAGDTVTATPTSMAPGTIAQGTANTAMEKLSLVTNANTATWTAVTVTKTGTLADAQVTTVKIYLDANANGTFEAASDTLISPALTTFSAGSASIALSAPQTINTTPKVYFIVYTLEPYATPAATIGASFAANTDLTVTSPDLVAGTNFPANSSNATVTDVADTVTVTPTNMAPATADQGSDYAAEKLSMATGADEAVWTALTVTKTGTLADAGVTAVKVYLDANANGTYESGADTLISPAVTTFSGGAAAITLSAAQTITATPKVYFVVYTLGTTAAAGGTVGARIAASGDVTLTAPDLVSGTFPMSSANTTVTDAADTITVTPTSLAPGTIDQGSDYAVEKLSLATNQETAAWTALTVAKTGTLSDAKIATVKIYLDANANGTYESASDTLISPAVTAFSGGSAAITLSAAQTITTTPKVYFIVYALDSLATIGATAGASVASNASLTVTAPDAVAAANLPASSSNSTVTDAADTAAVTATDVAGTAVGQNETKAFLKLSMATGADVAVWTALTVTKLGNLADGSVTAIKVYLDDGDGAFDSAVDTLVSPAATFTAGSAAITLSAAQTLTTTPKTYFIVYQIALAATVGNTIGARVATGNITLTAPDLVSGTFPMDSAAVTVAAPDTVTASRTSLAPASIGQGADYALEKLSLVTGSNSASLTAVKVTLAGTISRTNVTAVKVYADTGSGDYGNEDTLLAAGTFGGPGTVTLTLSPAQTITTTPSDFFVVYTLNAATPVGNTVGASIAASTDLTIASPDAMAATNFPLNSTNSTVDLPDYGVTVSPNLITVGSVNLNQSHIVATGITVTNVGNMGTTFSVKATTVTAGSPWVIATAPGADQYTMQALFNTTQPAVGDYTASDKILDSGTVCLGGKFEGNQGCQSVRPGNTRTLWINVGMPTTSSTQASQDFQINVTATPP